MMRYFYIAVLGFLFWFIASPSNAAACGWWDDGGIDDGSDPVMVDPGQKQIHIEGSSINDPEIQTRLGNSFRSGKGDARNYRDAVYWYRKAAEQGFAGAQNNLAAMFEEGLGVPKDESEAAKWYRRAAEGQNAEAQHSLGRMYRDGRGVPRDPAEAVRWIQRSAEQGHHGAFKDMGEMYWDGVNVPGSKVLAVMWWKLGVLYGDKESAVLLEAAAGKMEPASVAESEKLAREWLEKNK